MTAQVKSAKVKQQMVKMAVLENMRIKKRIVKQERQLKKTSNSAENHLGN